jgi:hypothetical protein
MTLPEALDAVQSIGSVRIENGKLKLRFPEPERARLEPAIEVLRRNRDAALVALTAAESGTVPPAEAWPESLAALAHERAADTGDHEAAREEVWMCWCEWKARALNRLFQEQGVIGEPGRITTETVRHGLERKARRKGGQ